MLLNLTSPQTLERLREQAENHPKYRVRKSALQALVKGCKDNPETLNVLKNVAHRDRAPEVVQTAIQELARGWQDDSETLNWLKTYAQYSQNPVVRSTAIQELARGWSEIFNVFEILAKCAFVDPFQRQNNADINPRKSALESAIAYYGDRPETWALVADRARNDTDRQVRSFAKEQLQQKADANGVI
ncbi:HEAT repeat domain-containing protein [Lusitaniella coriacea LEGE 07157]|uniref:HEAT repeat domain-containing protein n=1 Tax=Lusitaniella coriacea LEGE 07157 TaxID=945747 RepID=A0A8J7DZE2_9CYAN|nr:HEAT repeat domain-containing protein [Lusitaniella coriacea]MBE9118416.1 HEAT repeat domain-containing protein [Lusitaniella coriacea LEGE 07157]